MEHCDLPLLDDKRQVERTDGSRHRQDGDDIRPHRTRDIVTDHWPSPALKFRFLYSRAVLMNGYTGKIGSLRPHNSLNTVRFGLTYYATRHDKAAVGDIVEYDWSRALRQGRCA